MTEKQKILKKPVMWLKPGEIEVGWRARTDLGDIHALVRSIAQNGQIQPIVVMQSGGEDKYQVIAGVRRLTACTQLGFPVAAVCVSPSSEHHEVELQLEENLARKNFDALEIAEGLRRLKELYEKEHPETKYGATGGGHQGKGTRKKASTADRFTLKAAQSLGCGETKVKEFLQMAELPATVKGEIKKSKNSSERNKKVRQALKSVRLSRKKEKLKQQAEAIEKERIEAVDDKHPVVLKLIDNREFFADAEPETFEICLTDPPYGQRQSIISHALRGDIDSHFGAWDILDVGWILKVASLLTPGGQVLAFTPMEAVGEYKMACEACDLTWRGCLIWHKTNPGVVHRNTYLSSCEAIIWATKGGSYSFQPWENCGETEVHNYVEGPICSGNERLDHPTQKPEWIIERLLRRHTNPHSRVIDPFCGVGTTLAVCKKMGLPATGVDNNDKYIHQARIRLQGIK